MTLIIKKFDKEKKKNVIYADTLAYWWVNILSNINDHTRLKNKIFCNNYSLLDIPTDISKIINCEDIICLAWVWSFSPFIMNACLKHLQSLFTYSIKDIKNNPYILNKISDFIKLYFIDFEMIIYHSYCELDAEWYSEWYYLRPHETYLYVSEITTDFVAIWSWSLHALWMYMANPDIEIKEIFEKVSKIDEYVWNDFNSYECKY